MHRVSLLSFACALLTSLACEEADRTPYDHARADLPPDSDPQIPLTLETRAGKSATGWSFDTASVVDATEAHLLLSSTDCGTRGRWVQLEGHGVEVCTGSSVRGFWEPIDCGPSLEVGGSDPEIALNEVLFVLLEDGDVRPFVLSDRTDTPSDWLDGDVSFHVLLEEFDLF